MKFKKYNMFHSLIKLFSVQFFKTLLQKLSTSLILKMLKGSNLSYFYLPLI